MDQENKNEINTPAPETAMVPEAKKKVLNLPGAIVIAAVIIASSIFINKGGVGSEASADSLDLVAEVNEEDFVRGNDRAPITVIEYADFSCHFCAQYHPTLQKIVADFDGKVRWVYRHLPIFNKEAAIASSCVGRIGGDDAFWRYADTLYLNTDKFSTEFYQKGATDLGIKADTYEACINDPLISSKINREFTQARLLLGFNATPSTVIVDKAGRKFSFAGALSYEDVATAIEGLAK